MTDSLVFESYARTPFVVEVTEITGDNIEEIAKLIGVDGTVHGKGNNRYIPLHPRVVPGVSRAYVGWKLTRMDDNYRCYSPTVFDKQFVKLDALLSVSDNLVMEHDPANAPSTGEDDPIPEGPLAS